jgi:hypothetical protein
LNADTLVIGPLEGRAVLIDGSWKVSRETVCEIIANSGAARCPSSMSD